MEAPGRVRGPFGGPKGLWKGPGVILGLVLGFSYARTRNLLTPMLIHSLWNSGVLVVVAVAIKAGVASELGIPGF